MKKNTLSEPELSRPLQVDKIAMGGVEEHIVARPAERSALAKRFSLLDMSMLEADINVDHADRRMLAVTGVLRADVVQQCVISLEPVATHIEETIDVLFGPPNLLEVGANPPHGEEIDSDAPEPIVNGVIDLGELVAQHLAVALDPYPRKEGAVLNVPEANSSTASISPFDKLKKTKKPT